MSYDSVMIIIKNEIKTPNINYIKFDKNENIWIVKFKNSEVFFRYKNYDVEFIEKHYNLNPEFYVIKHKGKTLSRIIQLLLFKGKYDNYFRITFSDNKYYYFKGSSLEIKKSILSDKTADKTFKYLQEIASLNEIKNNDTDEQLLLKRYRSITFIDEKSALSLYLNPAYQLQHTIKEFIPIFPFGCNNSQFKALIEAANNRISVIQGPPGTGKTQTILNIIASILIQNKTVLVVSNNNSAILNIKDKLESPKYNLGFITAYLGNSDNTTTFIENQKIEYPNLSSWINTNITQDNISNLFTEVKQGFDLKELLANLQVEQEEINIEKKYHEIFLKEKKVELPSISIAENISSKTILNLWRDCEKAIEKKNKIGFLLKLKAILKYRIGSFDFYNNSGENIIISLQSLYFKQRSNEISQQIKEITNKTKDFDYKILEKYYQDSLAFLKKTIALKYIKNTNRPIFKDKDLYSYTPHFVNEYPIVLSTTFSAKSCLNPTFIFDYLIMDEASQVDIVTGALALSCARNVIIVGDTKQLPNVIENSVKAKADTIFQSYNINNGYCFTNSMLQSIIELFPNIPQTLLKEHYRCHPKIINFCNQQFYNDQLLPMTKDNNEKDVLKVIKTTIGNHDRSHYNQRQIDVIKNEVLPFLTCDKKDIGIITPYREQVKNLKSQIPGIEIDTVHKFQGREKDVIIISTVDNEITDFTDNPYLLNVAISRAKKQLILIITGNGIKQDSNLADLISYIEYNNFSINTSSTYSIFDYLYKQYKTEREKLLKGKKQASSFASENLMSILLEEILKDENFSKLGIITHIPLSFVIKDSPQFSEEESKYLHNIGTHLDFLIFNKVSKKPILAIEVDGFEYHKEGTKQAERDKKKNKLLTIANIPFLRFNTNGANEKEIIINSLKAILK